MSTGSSIRHVEPLPERFDMDVNEYAASEMRYWCRTNDFGGVGYSQPNRWSAYDNSNWQGYLTGPGEADCSSSVSGAYNIAFHECLSENERPPYFPRSTWTESLVAEATARGFVDYRRQLDRQYSGRRFFALVISSCAQQARAAT